MILDTDNGVDKVKVNVVSVENIEMRGLRNIQLFLISESNDIV